MSKYKEANAALWNELTDIHAKSTFYDLESFKKGKQTLRRVELEQLGNVSGKSLLHLQCHFGLDSLSLARLGAHVTGVDFSDTAIKLAKDLAAELKLDAQFICCDIYQLPELLDQKFDMVFTSYGVLVWLENLPNWAKVVNHFLKKGGKFLIVEEHPICHMQGHPLDGIVESNELHLQCPYFGRSVLAISWEGSYVDRTIKLSHSDHYQFVHTLSEIINSISDTGLRITSFHEFPLYMYHQFERLQPTRDGYWVLPENEVPMPTLFSLTATKD